MAGSSKQSKPEGPDRDVVEVYPDDADQFRWRRVAANGRIISSSGEAFAHQANAFRAAHRANPDTFGDDGSQVDVVIKKKDGKR